MEELIYGASMIRVIETNHLAAWEEPVLKFQVPPGSRPGDIITITEGWTADDEFYGFDVLITLRISIQIHFIISKGNVYTTISVRTTPTHKIRKTRITFPNGAVRDVEIYEVVKEPILLKFADSGLPSRGTDMSQTNGDFFVVIQPFVKENWARRLVSKIVPTHKRRDSKLRNSTLAN